MNNDEKELERFYESLVVLFRLSQDRNYDKIDDAIEDLIFNHGIKDEYYITKEEYEDTEKELIDLTGDHREDW